MRTLPRQLTPQKYCLISPAFVMTYYYFNFKRNYNVLKSKGPCIYVNSPPLSPTVSDN